MNSGNPNSRTLPVLANGSLLNPGMKPTSRGSDGPRLLAALAFAVYGWGLVADGRGWKYRGSGSPLASVRLWSIMLEPTARLARVMVAGRGRLTSRSRNLHAPSIKLYVVFTPSGRK